MYLSGCDAVIRVDAQHPPHEVGDLLGEVELVARVFSVVYLAVELLVCCSAKGEDAGQGHEGQNAQSPHICWLASVLLLLHDFGGHVAGRPAKNLDLSALFNAGAEPKIYEFGSQIIRQYYIL